MTVTKHKLTVCKAKTVEFTGSYKTIVFNSEHNADKY